MEIHLLKSILLVAFMFGGVEASWAQQLSSCSADKNPWGQPRSCGCVGVAKSYYNPYLGECQAQAVPAATSTLVGTVKTGIMAIGGETTGIMLSTPGASVELLFPVEQLSTIRKLDGKKIRVTGWKFTVIGVERKRIILAVQSYAAA